MEDTRVTGMLTIHSDGRGPAGYGQLAVDVPVVQYDSLYVQPGLIRQFHLRSGDQLCGLVRPPLKWVKEWHVYQLEHINGRDCEEVRQERIQALQVTDM